MFELKLLKDLTNNLDSIRKPLNAQERMEIQKEQKYPYCGANGVLEYVDKYLFNEKILCIAEDGGSWGYQEKCTYIMSEPCWVNNHAHVLTAKENVSLEYLSIYLNFMDLNKFITGTTRGKLTKSALEKIPVQIPSYDIQLKVVEILIKAKNIIDKRQSQITALDELTQSLFLEMFGDPKKNKNDYPVKSLTNFYENPKEAVKCGPFGSALKKDEYVSDGVPVWNMDNITKSNEFVDKANLFVTSEKSKSLQSYNVVNGDIIISRAGTVGKMCVVESKYENSLISTNLIRLRLNEDLTPEFLVYLIKIFGDKVCRMRTGNDGAFTHMNTGVLNSIEFPYPPIEEQREFVSRLNKIKQQKVKMEKGLANLKDLYNSLLQKAFKGELFQD